MASLEKNRSAFAAIVLSLFVCFATSQSANADEASSDPAPSDIEKSTDRGLFSEPVGGLGAVVKPVINTDVNTSVASPVKPVTSKTASSKVSPKSVTGKTNISKTTHSKNVNTSSGQVTAKVRTLSKPKSSTSTTTQTSTPANSADSLASVYVHKTDGDDSSIVITAWLNKKGQKPIYKAGEKLELNVTASSDCKLVVFDYDNKGNLVQIFPNDFQSDNAVTKGQVITIGGEDSNFEYEVAGTGEEKIFIYAYPTEEKPPMVAMANIPNSPFRTTQINIEEYRKLVNESKVFFAREIKVNAKSQIKNVAAKTVQSAPNKLELSFTIKP